MNDLVPFLFVIILVAMVMGTILLYPIVTRLGKLLEQRLQNRLPDDVMVRELRNLASAIHSVQHQVGQLSERQANIEARLPERDSLRLPVGSGKD